MHTLMSANIECKPCFCARTLRLFRGLLLALMYLLPWRPAVAATPLLSQRGINEMAAALESVRLTLIEDTGLRRPQEPLPVYLDRLALPQSGEAAGVYDSRMEGYLKSLRRAVVATAPARHSLFLRHTDAANQQCWQRAAQALSLLPARVDKLERAWRQARRGDRAAADPRLGGQLAQTLGLVLAGYSALRDARP